MNFVREVIDLAKENEICDSRKTITRLLDEMQKYQNKIRAHIEDNYVEFLPNLADNQQFLDEGSRLLDDVDQFKQHIDDTQNDLLLSTEEMEQQILDLQEAALGLKTSYKILKIDNLFQQIEESKNKREYQRIIVMVNEIKGYLFDPADVILKRLDCFDNLKIKYLIENELLVHNLTQQLESLVQLNEKNFRKTKSITVKITKNVDLLHDTIIALFNCKFNPRHMWDFLLNNILVPIILKPVSLEVKDDDTDGDDAFVSLILSFSTEEVADDLRPNYKIVFKNIETAIKCLSNMNISITDDQCVFSMFGECSKETFLNLLQNYCLAHSLPETIDEMNDSTIVNDVLALNKFLMDMLFFKEDDHELTDFANKISILFKNRFCTKIFDRGVEIMRMNLQDMILIQETDVLPLLVGSPALFPKCMVSKSTVELIQLLDKILLQSASTKDELNDRLLSTIKLILERYTAEVPTHHERLLQLIPQQTALFHNNCMYLAYWLTKNGPKGIESFRSIVKSLQDCGSEHFLYQISNQRDQLMEILKDFDLTGVTDYLNVQYHKVIKQCLRQLDLLKNVWQSILPDVVYQKTMGNILNDFCAEIIRRIFVVEDISSNVAKGLVDICDDIFEHGPYLFSDQLEVPIIVKTWNKLMQLRTMLDSSLAHIADLWSEGKGPLTLHYKADEVKHLIRALFQNTERRANALASII